MNNWSSVFDFLRLIQKIGQKVTELDDLHSKIYDVYSNGAVEGYSQENLGYNFLLWWPTTSFHTLPSWLHIENRRPRQEDQLLDLYKKAMRAYGPCWLCCEFSVE